MAFKIFMIFTIAMFAPKVLCNLFKVPLVSIQPPSQTQTTQSVTPTSAISVTLPGTSPINLPIIPSLIQQAKIPSITLPGIPSTTLSTFQQPSTTSSVLPPLIQPANPLTPFTTSQAIIQQQTTSTAPKKLFKNYFWVVDSNRHVPLIFETSFTIKDIELNVKLPQQSTTSNAPQFPMLKHFIRITDPVINKESTLIFETPFHIKMQELNVPQN